ncbi:hypothetical protein OS242_11235 [Tumebacillus sp. DT12]|uniref:Phosphatase n=1 Tax=Tumebacillus lacus TaxID=2995335 RepID=A0ABT3X263_9BACL|nr:hypothetical protein [Tumebacillus lacus]MCX7570536.1 hypothetical protein [Tumebacillus lacus]
MKNRFGQVMLFAVVAIAIMQFTTTAIVQTNAETIPPNPIIADKK